MKQRETFRSRLGFLLLSAGSTVLDLEDFIVSNLLLPLMILLLFLQGVWEKFFVS